MPKDMPKTDNPIEALYVELMLGIAKRFDVDLDSEDDECDHSFKCIVYVGYGDELAMRPLMFDDPECTKPMVFDYKHEAYLAVEKFVRDMAPKYIIAEALGLSRNRPKPEHFHLVAAEDKPDEEEITDTSDAVAVLSKFTVKEGKQ